MTLRIVGRNEPIVIGGHVYVQRYNAMDGEPERYQLGIGRRGSSMVANLTLEQITELRAALADPDSWPLAYILEDR